MSEIIRESYQGYLTPILLTHLGETDGPVVDLILTGTNVQTWFAAYSHRGHFQ